MKTKRVILFFAIIVASLLYSNASSIEHATNRYLVSATFKNQSSGKVQDKKASFTQSRSKDRCSVERASHSSVTARTEEHYSFHGIFLAFSSFAPIASSYHLRGKFQLQFIPHALKIIYPHHYFW